MMANYPITALHNYMYTDLAAASKATNPELHTESVVWGECDFSCSNLYVQYVQSMHMLMGS